MARMHSNAVVTLLLSAADTTAFMYSGARTRGCADCADCAGCNRDVPACGAGKDHTESSGGRRQPTDRTSQSHVTEAYLT